MREIREIRRSGNGIEVKVGNTMVWVNFDDFSSSGEFLDVVKERLDSREEDVSHMVDLLINDCLGVDIDANDTSD